MGARKNRIEQIVGLQIGRVRRQAKLGARLLPSDGTLTELERLLGNRRWLPTMQAWVEGQAEWSAVFIATRDSFKEELARLGYAHTLHCDVDERDPLYSLVFAADSREANAIMAGSIDRWRRDPELRQPGLF